MCMFIAASVPVEKAGDVNPLMEAAKEIGTDSAGVTAQSTVAAGVPFDPENPPIPDNNIGSFERFLGSFGNPQRWAGR